MKFILIYFSLFISSQLLAKDFPILDKVLNLYVKSSSVKIFLIKKEFNKLLNKKSVSKANLYIKYKKIKLIYLKPKNKKIIFNTKELWIINNKFIKYTNKKKIWSQIPLIQLFSLDLDLGHYFKIRWKQIKKNTRKYLLKVRLSKLKIKDFKIFINTKNNKIIKISYKDDIDNYTEYKFLKTQFNKKLKNSFFNFKTKNTKNIIVL